MKKIKKLISKYLKEIKSNKNKVSAANYFKGNLLAEQVSPISLGSGCGAGFNGADFLNGPGGADMFEYGISNGCPQLHEQAWYPTDNEGAFGYYWSLGMDAFCNQGTELYLGMEPQAMDGTYFFLSQFMYGNTPSEEVCAFCYCYNNPGDTGNSTTTTEPTIGKKPQSKDQLSLSDKPKPSQGQQQINRFKKLAGIAPIKPTKLQ